MALEGRLAMRGGTPLAKTPMTRSALRPKDVNVMLAGSNLNTPVAGSALKSSAALDSASKSNKLLISTMGNHQNFPVSVRKALDAAPPSHGKGAGALASVRRPLTAAGRKTVVFRDEADDMTETPCKDDAFSPIESMFPLKPEMGKRLSIALFRIVHC